MIATITAVGPPETRPTVRLFSRTAIGWLSFFCGFPAGILLLAYNWRQLGQRARTARYIAGAAGTSTRPSKQFTLQALDPRTGAATWRVDLDSDGYFTGPFATDRAIVVSTNRGQVLAFAPGSGERLWARTDIGGTLLALADTTLDLNNAAEGLLALDAATGRDRWFYPYPFSYPNIRPDSTVLVNSEGAYVWASGRDEQKQPQRALIALAADDGHERWRTPEPPDGLPGFIPDQGAIVVYGQLDSDRASKQRYGLVAYASTNGAVRWRLPIAGIEGRAVDDSHVFIVGHAPRWRNRLARVNPAWR